MKTLLIALAVLTAPTDSLPDLSHPWNLQECIDWAMDNNLTVAGSQLTVETRTIDNNTARMAWLPAVSGSVGENFSFGRGIGGNNTYEKGNSSSTSFSVGASMNLFDGLATPRRMQLAKLNLEAATADLEKARDDAADEAKKVSQAAQVSLEQARKEAEKQLRTEVGDLALQIAEKVIRKNIANDDAQRALVDQYLSEVETKN